MDAQAHLLSLGWAGPGHALDARPYKQKGHRGLAYDPREVRTTGNGLVKPLLISQRPGKFGIGKKIHEPQAGNEWWLKGFEAALGNIGKPKSEESSGTATPDHSNYKGKHLGLYGFFVKGQEMEGTIGKSRPRTSMKRKSDLIDEASSEASSPEPVASQTDTSVNQFKEAGKYFVERDKDKKQRSKPRKTDVMEDFQQVNEFFEATKAGKKLDKKSKLLSMAETEPNPIEDLSQRSQSKREDKEQRRKRSRDRHARKAGTGPALISEDLKAKTEDLTAKSARKAERKRRKSVTISTEIV